MEVRGMHMEAGKMGERAGFHQLWDYSELGPRCFHTVMWDFERY